jgi:hypothetical protein
MIMTTTNAIGNIVTAFLIMSVGGEFLVIVTAGLIKEKPVKISLG